MARFQYSLARELGMMRADLLRRMSVSEFIDWMAFFRLEQEDQAREIARAQDQATARQMVRSMR